MLCTLAEELCEKEVLTALEVKQLLKIHIEQNEDPGYVGDGGGGGGGGGEGGASPPPHAQHMSEEVKSASS